MQVCNLCSECVLLFIRVFVASRTKPLRREPRSPPAAGDPQAKIYTFSTTESRSYLLGFAIPVLDALARCTPYRPAGNGSPLA